MGGVLVAWSCNELCDELIRYIQHPDVDKDLRCYTLEQECGEDNDKETEQVVNVL